MKSLVATTKLHEIVAAKKAYLDEQKLQKSQAQHEKELESFEPFMGPSFFDALKAQQPKPKLIAEVKKASPSRGVIRNNFSLSEINDAYQTNSNVVAISVLTEKDYFHGSEDILSFFAKNNTNNKPLLRKDFIFDPYQILETKLLGAQAYLLMASLFDDSAELESLITFGQNLGLEPLVEVHTKEELELVKATSARVIGVNSRDMKTLAIDNKIHDLLKDIDNTYAKVAESGIDSGEELGRVLAFCDAALIGTHFMSQENIGGAIEELVVSVANKDRVGI
jgi:indole-3-glycerol phosphate synthase